MQESQNIEWKEIWKDEYLKWVCGFANASSGKIFIGKNDKGEVVGVKNSKKLVELNIIAPSGSKGAGAYYILK